MDKNMRADDARNHLRELMRYVNVWDDFFGLLECDPYILDDTFELIIEHWNEALEKHDK